MIVYKITNKINNKFYIGITSRSIKQRFNSHVRQARYLLGQAVKKYGKNNFVIKQIDTATSFEKLKEKEQYYITKLKPHYNLTKGGDGIIGYKHKEKFIKFRKKYMKGNKLRKGIFFTEQQKKKISESLKGNTNKLGKTGAKLSNEFKEYRRKIMLQNNPAKRPDVREKLRLASLRREALKRELRKSI